MSYWHVNSCFELITLWLNCLHFGTGMVAFALQSRTNSSCYSSQLLCVLDRVILCHWVIIHYLRLNKEAYIIIFLAGKWFLEGLTNKNISLRTLKHLYGVSLQCGKLLASGYWYGLLFFSLSSFFAWFSPSMFTIHHIVSGKQCKGCFKNITGESQAL